MNIIDIVKVEDHQKTKYLLLTYIEHDINTKPGLVQEDVTTDYFCNDNNRSYVSIAKDLLNPYINKFADTWKLSDLETCWWFQRYDRSQYHMWHNHPDTTFAMVYYLDMKYGDQGTELYNKKVDVAEGDVLFFPAFWPHRSASNPYDSSKTVIVANLTFKSISLPSYP